MLLTEPVFDILRSCYSLQKLKRVHAFISLVTILTVFTIMLIFLEHTDYWRRSRGTSATNITHDHQHKKPAFTSRNSTIFWRPIYSLTDRLSMPRQPVSGLAGAFKPNCHHQDGPCIAAGSSWFGEYDSWKLMADDVFYPLSCPYRCQFVSDVSEADAILFHGRDLPTRPPNFKRHPKQLWVYMNFESPHATSKMGFNVAEYPAYHTLFNWTSTYQRDSNIPAPTYFVKPRLVAIKPTLPNLKLKKRLAYIVLSNCDSTFNSRTEAVRRLQTFMDIEIYGGCSNRKLPQSHEAFKELGKQYYFYLSFENAFCKEYITEKFYYNALTTDAAPVAIGGRSRHDYEAVAPPNSFVYGLDYKTASELAQHLRRLAADPKAYLALFAWRATHQVTTERFLCSICRALYTSMPEKVNDSEPKQIVAHLSSYYSIEKNCYPLNFTYLF